MLRTRQQGEVTCSPCPLTCSESILARPADKSRADALGSILSAVNLPNLGEVCAVTGSV